jgi:hypothetical protein
MLDTGSWKYFTVVLSVACVHLRPFGYLLCRFHGPFWPNILISHQHIACKPEIGFVLCGCKKWKQKRYKKALSGFIPRPRSVLNTKSNGRPYARRLFFCIWEDWLHISENLSCYKILLIIFLHSKIHVLSVLLVSFLLSGQYYSILVR